MTEQQLTLTAQLITEMFTDKMITEMYNLPGGDEILRLIVRDNIGNAADRIVNALWDAV